MASRHRVEKEAVFLLQKRPFTESSLLLEIFSRHHGRLTVLAKGARRFKSPLKGSLQVFQLLSLSWVGKSEIKTLTQAELLNPFWNVTYQEMMTGYYLNELILKLLPKDDPYPKIFDAYQGNLIALRDSKQWEKCLREFEINLLKELGYGMSFDVTVDKGVRIEETQYYNCDIHRGSISFSPSIMSIHSGAGLLISGKTLRDMNDLNFTNKQTLKESKQLMRMLLGYHLGSQVTKVRRVFSQVNDYL